MATGDIELLIQLMSKLPGLGPRSARRAALHLIKNREQLLKPSRQQWRPRLRALNSAVLVAIWIQLTRALFARTAGGTHPSYVLSRKWPIYGHLNEQPCSRGGIIF